jgi:uncharacterized protein YbcV (DUF1398 family)
MDKNIIKETVQASLAAQISFPQVVGKLLSEGVSSYHVDLVRMENRYYSSQDETHLEPKGIKAPKISQNFSAEKVAAAVKSSQAGTINYQQFIELIAEAGTSYYVAYLTGKKVIYFGREGDSRTEHFPGSK